MDRLLQHLSVNTDRLVEWHELLVVRPHAWTAGRGGSWDGIGQHLMFTHASRERGSTWVSVLLEVTTGRKGGHTIGRACDVPVGRWATSWSSEVQPWLAVGTRSVVCDAIVGRAHVTVASDLTWVGTCMGVLGVHTVCWVVGRDERSLRAVDLGKCVDVLQLRSSQVSLVSLATTSVSTSSAGMSTWLRSSRSSVVVLGERGVFSGQLRLDSLAVRGVSDRRQDWSDGLDQNHSLAHVTVVQDGLDDIVSVAVP